MKILAVDIGTGTQDIYLYDSRLDMENNFKLVVPSPTMIIRRQIMEATQRGEAILLTGVIMGGGPSSWAVEAHLRAGMKVYATAEAARTINDDLEAVKEMGVVVVSDDEAENMTKMTRALELRDFDFPSIQRAFGSFGVSLADLDLLAIGVFDHGNAPVGTSDRKFRFDYLDERIRKLNRLSAFAYRGEDVPAEMTRLQCVVESARESHLPVVVMDTAPAAVLGATLDPSVARREGSMIANIGNFHTLAFRLGRNGIEGLFEHHTGLIDRMKLETLLLRLAEGTLLNADVFHDQGHGALMYDSTPLPLGTEDYDVVITGPRRNMYPPEISGTQLALRAYFPAPFGDMMITGCFGLLAAVPEVMPELAEPIQNSLRLGGQVGTAPWDVG